MHLQELRFDILDLEEAYPDIHTTVLALYTQDPTQSSATGGQSETSGAVREIDTQSPVGQDEDGGRRGSPDGSPLEQKGDLGSNYSTASTIAAISITTAPKTSMFDMAMAAQLSTIAASGESEVSIDALNSTEGSDVLPTRLSAEERALLIAPVTVSGGSSRGNGPLFSSHFTVHLLGMS